MGDPTNVNEPAWTSDPDLLQRIDQDQSALCNMRFTPSVITGVLLRLLQAHFSDPANIRDDKLKGLQWQEDLESSNQIQSAIIIAPTYKYDARTLSQRPSILVTRGPVSTDRIAIANKTLTGMSGGYYLGDKHVRAVMGQHIIRCVSKGAFAAERLGEEVFYRTLEYLPAIKNELPISDIQMGGLGAAKLIDEEQQNFAVDVVVEWKHTHGWTLIPIAPILKKVRFEADPK